MSPSSRNRLWDNVKYLQRHLRDAGVDIGDSVSQVVPIMIRDDDRVFGSGRGHDPRRRLPAIRCATRR